MRTKGVESNFKKMREMGQCKADALEEYLRHSSIPQFDLAFILFA